MANKLEIERNIKFYGLDNLRAFAIIMVLLYHASSWFDHPAWIPKIFEFGWTGVDLFFVLSGFLISSQLFAQIKKERNFSLKEFYVKRIFRVLPVYFFVLFLYFNFPFFCNDLGVGQKLPPLWKFLTFTQNLGSDFQNERSFTAVWSLCVEEHFYLLLPITLWILLKTKWFKKSYLLLLLLFIFGFLIRLYLWYKIEPLQHNKSNFYFLWINTIYMPTYCRSDGLLVGVSIAALYNFSTSLYLKLTKYANFYLATGVFILIACYFYFGNDFTFSGTLFGLTLSTIGFGFLVFFAIIPNSLFYNWKSAALTKMADISYSLYLSHTAVILSTHTIFADLGIAKNSSLMFVLSIIFSILVALLLHNSIEKPFMKMRKWLIKPTGILNNI